MGSSLELLPIVNKNRRLTATGCIVFRMHQVYVDIVGVRTDTSDLGSSESSNINRNL